AFLFGSFAQGRQKSASDVDLFIIGDVSFTAIARSLVESQRQLKREINPTVYGPAEFIAKLGQGHPFLTRVLAAEKVFLVGDDSELSRVAKERLASAASGHARRGRRPARRYRARSQDKRGSEA